MYYQCLVIDGHVQLTLGLFVDLEVKVSGINVFGEGQILTNKKIPYTSTLPINKIIMLYNVSEMVDSNKTC